MSSGPVLTTQFAYAPKPSVTSATSLRVVSNPINGTNNFSGANAAKIIFEIPGNQKGSFLNCEQSYLNFSVLISDGVNATYLDNSAYCLFDRFVLSHNGVILESYESQYGFLCNLAMDVQCSHTMRQADLSISVGTVMPTDLVTNFGRGMQLSTVNKAYFSIPLMSGIIGTMASKYFPLGAISGAPLRIELTLNPQALVSASASGNMGYTLNDVELVMEQIMLTDKQAGDWIHNMTIRDQGRYVIPHSTWRCFNATVNSGVQSSNVLIPIKCRSLRSIIVAQRKTTALTTTNVSKYNREGGVRSYQFMIGPYLFPQKPVDSVPMMYSELMKAWHALGITASDSAFSRTNYVTNTTATAAGGCTFLVGLDTEAITNKGEVVSSGINTMNDLVFYNPTWAVTLTEGQRIDSFCMFDQNLIIDQFGQCSVEN